MSRDRLLAFAQLLRLPNVFTAFADIALGAAVGSAVLPSPSGSFWAAVALIALASGFLYLAGMVWNDVFDRAEDARARSFRPIPSGRVSVRLAIGLGVLLMALGLAFAALAGLPGRAQWTHEPLAYAIGIAIAVLLYDGGLKRTPVGPVAMASCRFLNVLLGLSILAGDGLETGLRIHIAGVIGAYIVGVTWFARTEEGRSNRQQLLAAAFVMLLALVLALILRAKLPAASGTVFYPYLLVAFGFLIGLPVARAIATPGPREVQRAVKRCVLGLVALDAVIATAFVGLPGLAILLLLPPALVIGKWVYST
jgi:4-hydroxybenzoate polyprenyltransferase